MLTTPEPDPQPAPAVRSSGRRRLIGAIAIVLLAAIAAYLLTRRDELEYFRRLSAAVLLATLLFQLLSQLLWNQAMLLPLRAYMKLGFWELFVVRSGGLLAGALVPVAGNIGVRLAYLRRRGLGYSDFTWATIVSSVLALFASAALAVMAVAILWARTGDLSRPVVVLTAALLALGIAALLSLRILPRLAGHRWARKWTWIAAMSRHTIDPVTAGWILAASFGRHVFSFLSFGLLYQSLSRPPGELLTGGLVYAITSPIRIVTITPGNLGIIEWVVAVVGKLLSFDLTTGLVVALVFRGMSIGAQALGVLTAGMWMSLRGESL
jgi:uncharacterized membrane protein YbhN (UPF0104 family)